MKSQRKAIELSIIIPVLDEQLSIDGLFATLFAQSGVSFEVILSDGGSSDATCRAAEECAFRYGIPMKVVSGDRGRGIQLNTGAAAAGGEFFLFLHADSRFENPRALRKGIQTLTDSSNPYPAAKFSLRFDRGSAPPSLAYYFYESKARLVRAECTHGDQGLMMRRVTFATFGPFDEFPQMLAESRLAERIRMSGALRLIPAEILTSPRRFETEGLLERQALNAILMNCADQGWNEPFRAVSEIYRNQSDAGCLPLSLILETINRLIQDLPPQERSIFWRSTGRYVRRNAWQIAFLLDSRRNFAAGSPPGQGTTPFLNHFDRFAAPALDCHPFNHAATALTWCWFNLTRLFYRTN